MATASPAHDRVPQVDIRRAERRFLTELAWLDPRRSFASG